MLRIGCAISGAVDLYDDDSMAAQESPMRHYRGIIAFHTLK